MGDCNHFEARASLKGGSVASCCEVAAAGVLEGVDLEGFGRVVPGLGVVRVQKDEAVHKAFIREYFRTLKESTSKPKDGK